MTTKRYPLVVVDWLDAMSEGGWNTITTYQEKGLKSYAVRSVGFLIAQSAKVLVLLQTRNIEGDRGTDTISIPRGMVQRVHRLKEPV